MGTLGWQFFFFSEYLEGLLIAMNDPQGKMDPTRLELLHNIVKMVSQRLCGNKDPHLMIMMLQCISEFTSWGDPEGGGSGQGVWTPLENHKWL